MRPEAKPDYLDRVLARLAHRVGEDAMPATLDEVNARMARLVVGTRYPLSVDEWVETLLAVSVERGHKVSRSGLTRD